MLTQKTKGHKDQRRSAATSSNIFSPHANSLLYRHLISCQPRLCKPHSSCQQLNVKNVNTLQVKRVKVNTIIANTTLAQRAVAPLSVWNRSAKAGDLDRVMGPWTWLSPVSVFKPMLP